MDKNVKLAIKEYQCSGCISGHDLKCFKPSTTGGVGCGLHRSGTKIMGIGNIFLGMPKGFNRLGRDKDITPNIYTSFEESDWGYDKFNIPVWKYLSPEGHTFVRGIMPRLNINFIHIYLEDCINKINCLEITQDDIDNMD